MLVNEDGTLQAETTKSGDSIRTSTWYVTTPLTPESSAAVQPSVSEAGNAIGAIARELRESGKPQKVIAAHWSDVCTNSIDGMRAPKRPRSRYRGPYAAGVRHILGLAQQELADALSIDRGNIKSWEASKYGAGEDIAADLKKLLTQHDAEAAELITIVERGETAILPRGPMPQGWYVALSARVILAAPEAQLRWEPRVT